METMDLPSASDQHLSGPHKPLVHENIFWETLQWLYECGVSGFSWNAHR